MKKSTIVAIISAVIALFGVLLLGVEALDGIDPHKLRVYAYITAAGLGGLVGVLIYRLHRLEKKKQGPGAEKYQGKHVKREEK